MCEGGKDLYAVLGASSADSAQQLRHRYQQLVLQYHPDRVGAGGSSEAEAAMKKFLEVDAAWKVLRDQRTRRQYDLQQRAGQLQQDWPVDCTLSLEDLTWDQDECVHTHRCRCGGGFSISEEDVSEEQRRQAEEEEEEEEEEDRGVVVCCDTCSLSVFITWPPATRTGKLISDQ